MKTASKRDIYFLREAYRIAGIFSKDPNTQNGAILVRNNEIISYGANRFPRGVRETEERWRYPLKPFYVAHAEENAIVNAARAGISTLGAIMYCPWFSCDRCAGMIVNSGIIEVVGHSAPDIWYEPKRKEENKSTWDESIKHGLTKLEEGGVKIRWIHGEIGEVSITFMGKRVTP